jgi:hypothetical protein
MDEALNQFSDEADAQAERLLSEAFDPQRREGHQEPEDRERWGFVDISQDLNRMARQVSFYGREGFMFPGVVVEGETDPVPIDVPSLASRFLSGGGGYRWWNVFRRYGAWTHYADPMAGGMLPNAEIRGIPPEAVRRAARRPLLQALANRLLGRTAMSVTSTAPFILHCRRNGATCHGSTAFYTPAYFITLGPYGSVLTSPVPGSLAPGYYHFGVDNGTGSGATIDYNKRFDVPINTSGTIDV